MAKKKIDFDVTGLSWQDVVASDPIHMKNLSLKSLARATSRLVSAYNKRARRLEASGYAEASPAYRGLVEEGKTRLSVKGKNWSELMQTYADAKRLLTERKTFSVGGTKSLLNETTKRIGHEFADKDEAKRYWEAIDKLKEKDIGGDKRTSTDVQREVADMMFNEDASVDDVLAHYGVIMENETPDAISEMDELIGFGEDEEDEEDEDGLYSEEEWDW